MRKCFYFILSILLVFAFTACDSDQNMPQLKSEENALLINSRAFIGGLRSLEVSADYTDQDDTDRRSLSVDWQSDTWNNTDNKPVLLISVGDEVYEVPSGNYDYNSNSSIHIAYQIKYGADDNEVRLYLCDKSHYDRNTISLMFEDQNGAELMSFNSQNKKAFNFIFTSVMTIDDLRNKRAITFKPLGTVLLFDAEVVAGEDKRITITSDCFDMGCQVNLKNGQSKTVTGEIAKTYTLKRGTTDRSIYGIYCISKDKSNGTIVVSGIADERKTYTIEQFSQYSGKFINLSTKEAELEVRPEDDDWFVTEWKGDHIRFYDIVGRKKLYAEYREKGSSQWIEHDIVLGDDKVFSITGLDSEKTYEVRLYGMTRVETNEPEIKLVTQWGTTKWTNLHSAFANCVNLDVVTNDVPNLSMCKQLANMFVDCANLKGNSKFNDWDVSNIESMNSMFTSAVKFNQPLDRWNVSNVKEMEAMFLEATAFDQDISMWNVANVESSMFFCELSGIEDKPEYQPQFPD